MIPFLQFIGILGLYVGIANGSPKGCVELDDRNFDKILGKFEVALVKFDNAYPYGPEHEAFEQICESSAPIDEILVAEVQVKDYGDKDNMHLAHKYGAKKKHYPALKLFKKGVATPISFDKETHGAITAENIKKFVKANTGVRITQPGCIRAFDIIVLEFMKSNDPEGRKIMLKRAEELLEDYKDTRAAELYVKLMKKVLEKGDDFVKAEILRVENILKEKLTKEKKQEMTERINILDSFKHDEL